MLSCKTFHLETCGGILLLPKIIEFVSDRGLSMFTWPSSQILSAFVASRSELFRDLRVLELGAGTALPSIVAGLCGVRSVIITERCDEPDILRNINDIIQINCSQSKCVALPLNWGLISETDLDSIGRVDVVLGADVFYSSEAFDSVLLTFLSVLSRDPHAVFFTTYQERRYANHCSCFMQQHIRYFCNFSATDALWYFIWKSISWWPKKSQKSHSCTLFRARASATLFYVEEMATGRRTLRTREVKLWIALTTYR
jgi:hypothetical protein